MKHIDTLEPSTRSATHRPGLFTMKLSQTLLAVFMSLTGFLTPNRAQEVPALPKPTPEHQWLSQLVGEWESDVEAIMEPGKPPMKAKSTETTRMLGGIWMISEGKGEIPGMSAPCLSMLTLGYDPEKKKYVGTWVDSVTNYLWKYEGTTDAAGKILTLDTEGPSPAAPSKISKFRETIEIKSKDHKVFSSSILGDDGKWFTFVTVNSRRKK
jgi:hypothetical protein